MLRLLFALALIAAGFAGAVAALNLRDEEPVEELRVGEPGRPVWSVAPGGPRFPAFDATGVERGSVRDNAVTIALSSVDGPGEFAAYTLSEWGRPTVVLDSRSKDRTRLAAGTRLDYVLATTMNLGEVKTRGVDLSLLWRLPRNQWGNMALTIEAPTVAERFARASVLSSPGNA